MLVISAEYASTSMTFTTLKTAMRNFCLWRNGYKIFFIKNTL